MKITDAKNPMYTGIGGESSQFLLGDIEQQDTNVQTGDFTKFHLRKRSEGGPLKQGLGALLDLSTK